MSAPGWAKPGAAAQPVQFAVAAAFVFPVHGHLDHVGPGGLGGMVAARFWKYSAIPDSRIALSRSRVCTSIMTAPRRGPRRWCCSSRAATDPASPRDPAGGGSAGFPAGPGFLTSVWDGAGWRPGRGCRRLPGGRLPGRLANVMTPRQDR